MGSWGSALGGLSSGFRAGYDVTSSALDRYEMQQAKDELNRRLEEINKPVEEGVKVDYVGAVPVEDRSTPFSGDELTPAEPGSVKKPSPEPSATTAKSPKKTDSATGTSKKSTGKIFSIGGVPVEDRSTEYKPNNVAPTDTGEKVVRNRFKVGNVEVEDASTPYMPNDLMRNAGNSRAIQMPSAQKAQPASMNAEEAFARYMSTNAPQQQRRTSAISVGTQSVGRNPSSDFYASYAKGTPSQPAASRPPVNNVDNFYAQYAKGTPSQPAASRQPVDNVRNFYAEYGKGTPSKLATSKAPANHVDNFYAEYGKGTPSKPASTKPAAAPADPTEAFFNDYAKGTPSQPASQRAIQTPADPSGAFYKEYGTGTPSQPMQGASSQSGGQQQPQQTRAIQNPAEASPQAPAQNTYTDTNFRAKQRAIAMAEAQYLLKVDPRAGVAAMKQINMQDAQWELSDMYRNAMQGDPESLGKIVRFMNLGQADGGISVSEDGRYVTITAADGTTKTEPITPQMVMQTLPMVQATYMFVNGLASDKAAEMMQSMLTAGLERQKTESEIAKNRAYSRYLDNKGAGTGSSKMRLLSYTDADGNPALLDQTYGGRVDLRTGTQYPQGVDPEQFKQWASEKADWASDVVVRPEVAGLISKDGTQFLNYLTGEIVQIGPESSVNPNRVDTTSNQKEPGVANDNSLAVDMIIGFEGFSETPYQDYQQQSIGYGTKAREGETSISRDEARNRVAEYVSNEIDPVLMPALARGAVQLTPEQLASVKSTCFNVGVYNFINSKAFAVLLAGDFERYAHEVGDPEAGFTKTRTAMGGLQVNPGLVERRKKELEPFLV